MGIIFKTISRLSHKILISPYKNVKSVFSRREYQPKSGNLAHAHIILAVDWEKLSEKGTVSVKNNLDKILYLISLDLMILRILLQRISFQVKMRWKIMLNQPLIFLLKNVIIYVWLKHKLVN